MIGPEFEKLRILNNKSKEFVIDWLMGHDNNYNIIIFYDNIQKYSKSGEKYHFNSQNFTVSFNRGYFTHNEH